MPELPEVEIQRRMLHGISAGARIERVERRDDARFEGDPSRLQGLKVTRWRRAGKYLIGDLGPWSILSHLGMTGQWVLNAASDRPHQRVVVHFDNGQHVGLIDPRRFGWTWILPSDQVNTHPRIAALGLDPLAENFTAPALMNAVGLRRTALKNRLMDQQVVSGLGNIALSEVCWRASVHPHQPCREVSSDGWPRLVEAILSHIHYVLEVEEGDEIVYLGYEGAVNPFVCYGRSGEPCPRCDDHFAKGKLAGRASYWCPTCQPLP
jgi:formamidopyrimidine-DNA glycosylase